MKSFIALALALTWSTTHAIKIDTNGVAPPVNALNKFQTLEKSWSISGESGLHNLLVQAPGIVFVDYDASLSDALIAKVVVSGDSEDLLNAFEVVSWNEHDADGVELRFKPGKVRYHGHLFTQILVGDKQTLKSIKSVASADVVISDDVLVNNDASAALELVSHGSGDVTVKSTQKLAVGTVYVTTYGSGDVEVNAESIDVSKSISLSAHGSGDVALVAKEIKTDQLNVKSSGSGDIYVQADNVVANTIGTVESGSGGVNFSRGGKCVKHVIKLSGSGSVAAGSIVSDFSDVVVSGSGSVLVQAKEKLVAKSSGSGSIEYVGVTPREVVVKGRSSHRGHHYAHENKVKQASHNEFDTFTPDVVHRTPQLVTIYVGNSDWSTGSFDSLDDSSDDNVWVSNLAASLPSSARLSSPVAVVGLLGVVVGLVGVAVRKYRQHRRSEFTRLI
jgi:hypothetical protein